MQLFFAALFVVASFVILGDIVAAIDILESATKCNAIGQLESLNVQGCESLPCTFAKGQRYSISAQFTPKGKVENLTLALSARVTLIDVPFLTGDACEYLAGDKPCPLEDGVKQSFKVDFRISKLLPVLSTKLTAIVKDENGNVQACAKVPVQIVNSIKEN